MGKTSIEWTDATWNPIRGTKGRWHCTHVSEGCRNCYAERLNVRWGGPAYKPGADTFRLDEKILEQPLHWRQPRKIFVCDMTDLFHEEIPRKWVHRVWEIMQRCPRHTFQVLTKRAEHLRKVTLEFPDDYVQLSNVWLGVSVEDQPTADERILELVQLPAAVRFVSYEPALGPVTFHPPASPAWKILSRYYGGNKFDPTGSQPVQTRQSNLFPKIDWVIIGGESGPKARPCDVAWIRSAVQQCQAAKVPVFVKQLGAYIRTALPIGGLTRLWLKHKKGGDPSEWPEDLRVREWPKLVTP